MFAAADRAQAVRDCVTHESFALAVAGPAIFASLLVVLKRFKCPEKDEN